MTKSNKKKQQTTFLLVLCVLICPFVFRYMDIGTFLTSSWGMILTFVSLLACAATNYNIVVKRSNWILFTVTIVLLFTSFLKNGSYGVVVTFLNLCLFLIVLNNVSFSLRQVQIARIVAIVFLVLLISDFKFIWKYGELLIYDGYEKINLNTYGILLLALYLNVVSLIDLSIKKKIIKYILLVIATPVALYYISQSDCRSALVSVFFLVVIVFIEKVNYKKMLFLLVLSGFLIPVLYISLHETLGGLDFLGKSLYTGREAVWLHSWEFIKEAPILGSGTSERIVVQIGEITDSTHNIYLAFWKAIGIAPMLMFLWCLLNGENINTMTEKNVWSKKAFLACMVVSLVETLLNDPNYNFLFMLLLMNVDEEFNHKKRWIW